MGCYYYYYIAVLLLVAFSNGNDQIDASSNVTLELIPSAQSVIEGNDFMFSCNSTEMLNISILINGLNSSNTSDHIIIHNGSDMDDFYVVNVTLTNTTYADNGTVLTCVGITNDTQYNSTDFTLQVYYPPRLSTGDNMTGLHESETGVPILLTASVLMANPPIDSFNITYDAANTTGINATTTGTDGMVSIMSPVPSNRGNYTFNATNSVGSTTYTYRTFIGGAADKLNITCSQLKVGDRAIISCTATDLSDAPALGVHISVSGLVDEYYLPFPETDVPAVGLALIPVNVSLYEVSAAKYNLYIESVNMIDNISVFTEAYYIPGYFVGSFINASNTTILEGDNFSFNCSAPPELRDYTTNFTVLVNDVSPDDRLVADGPFTNGTQSFVFKDTSYLDNGAVFVCVANKTIQSNSLKISILYAPKYFNVLETEPLVSGAPGMLSVNMTSNPPPTVVMWTLNGALLLNGSDRITYNASQIVFTSVAVNDTGNYTVIAENDIGNTSFSFTAEVYYAPIIKVDDQLFGYYNTSFVLSIEVKAYPANYTTVWYKDDEELISGNGTTVTDNNITFASLTPSDNATYTVHVNNSVGESMEAINLGVYFGPIFAQLTNDTVWMEYATDSDFSYICEVVSSFPAVTELNFTLTDSENSDIIKNETKSIELRVTKASQKNRQNYTCLGETGYTSGYTTFQTFVGGAPDGVTVNVSMSKENNKLNFFITISDNSDAPARSVIYTNPITNKNGTIEIPYPLFDGMSYAPADEFLSFDESELTGGQDYLLVYANNSLGEYFVKNISIITIPTTTPGPSPTKPAAKKSKGAAIAAGILVPVCVIAVVVGVAVVVYFYMKNKRNSYGFSALQSMSNDNERDVTVTTYGTGKINN